MSSFFSFGTATPAINGKTSLTMLKYLYQFNIKFDNLLKFSTIV